MGGRYPASGFGTIEVLVALSLFGFVLVAIIGLLIGSMSAGATAESSSIASNLARQRLEEVSKDIAERGTLSSYPSTMTVGGRTYTFTMPPPTTTLTSPGNYVCNIQVTVDYQVAYGSACASDGACTGNVRTYSRTLESRVRSTVPCP